MEKEINSFLSTQLKKGSREKKILDAIEAEYRIRLNENTTYQDWFDYTDGNVGDRNCHLRTLLFTDFLSNPELRSSADGEFYKRALLYSRILFLSKSTLERPWKSEWNPFNLKQYLIDKKILSAKEGVDSLMGRVLTLAKKYVHYASLKYLNDESRRLGINFNYEGGAKKDKSFFYLFDRGRIWHVVWQILKKKKIPLAIKTFTVLNEGQGQRKNWRQGETVVYGAYEQDQWEKAFFVAPNNFDQLASKIPPHVPLYQIELLIRGKDYFEVLRNRDLFFEKCLDLAFVYDVIDKAVNFSSSDPMMMQEDFIAGHALSSNDFEEQSNYPAKITYIDPYFFVRLYQKNLEVYAGGLTNHHGKLQLTKLMDFYRISGRKEINHLIFTGVTGKENFPDKLRAQYHSIEQQFLQDIRFQSAPKIDLEGVDAAFIKNVLGREISPVELSIKSFSVNLSDLKQFNVENLTSLSVDTPLSDEVLLSLKEAKKLKIVKIVVRKEQKELLKGLFDQKNQDVKITEEGEGMDPSIGEGYTDLDRGFAILNDPPKVVSRRAHAYRTDYTAPFDTEKLYFEVSRRIARNFLVDDLPTEKLKFVAFNHQLPFDGALGVFLLSEKGAIQLKKAHNLIAFEAHYLDKGVTDFLLSIDRSAFPSMITLKNFAWSDEEVDAFLKVNKGKLTYLAMDSFFWRDSTLNLLANHFDSSLWPEVLELSGGFFTENGLANFFSHQKSKAIRLGVDMEIGPSVYEEIIKNCKHLNILDFSNISRDRLDSSRILEIKNQCPHLTLRTLNNSNDPFFWTRLKNDHYDKTSSKNLQNNLHIINHNEIAHCPELSANPVLDTIEFIRLNFDKANYLYGRNLVRTNRELINSELTTRNIYLVNYLMTILNIFSPKTVFNFINIKLEFDLKKWWKEWGKMFSTQMENFSDENLKGEIIEKIKKVIQLGGSELLLMNYRFYIESETETIPLDNLSLIEKIIPPHGKGAAVYPLSMITLQLIYNYEVSLGSPILNQSYQGKNDSETCYIYPRVQDPCYFSSLLYF